MLVSNSCMTRSSMSGFLFNILASSVSAFIFDKEFGDRPPWLYSTFRLLMLGISLCFNVARLIYAIYMNDLMLVMMTVRCVGIFLSIVRHFYLCRYCWKQLISGELSKRLFLLHQVTDHLSVCLSVNNLP